MTEGRLLLFVFGLIYLSDCFLWIGKGSVVFIGGLFGGWFPKFANPYFGTDSGGVTSLNLFPSAGRVFCAYLVPISISRTGIVSYNSQTIKVTVSTQAVFQQYQIEQVQNIRNDGQEIRINGEVFCKCGHFSQAESLIKLVTRLKRIPFKKRDRLIRRFWERQYDLSRARDVHSQVKNQVHRVNLLGDVLFFILFFISPLAVFLVGLHWTILIVALLMFSFAIVIAIIFYRCHRNLFPGQKADRVIEVIKMIICPPVAIRSADQLSKNALSGYSPFVVAHLLLSAEKFRVFAGELFRCLKYPLIDKSLERAVLDVVEWNRKTLLEVTEGFFRAIKLDTMEFIASPVRSDEKSVTYCPRCLSQSYISEGECSDCVGIKLVHW